jgi:hypothetical protein
MTGKTIIDFSKEFDLVPHDRLLTKIAATGVDFEDSCMGKGISLRTFTES